MKAIVYYTYGSPDDLELRDVEKPVVPDDGVLVRVHAASVNPLDRHSLTGTPYITRIQLGLRKPKSEKLGFFLCGKGVRARRAAETAMARRRVQYRRAGLAGRGRHD